MIHFRRGLMLGAVVIAAALPALPQQDDPEVHLASNLELMRSLASRIGDSVAQVFAGHDSAVVSVTVLPKDLAWYVESALLGGLTKHRLGVRASGEAPFVAEFGLEKTGVEYTHIRRDGFLGPKVVDRNITLIISAKVVDERKGDILVARDFREENRDTIQLSEVGRVENFGLPLTHGEVPGEGFFSSFAEPLVLLGAIGVAVYLLFTVRS